MLSKTPLSNCSSDAVMDTSVFDSCVIFFFCFLRMIGVRILDAAELDLRLSRERDF